MKSIFQTTTRINTLKNIVVVFVVLAIYQTHLFAQVDKKVEAAIQTFNEGKFDKAIASMHKIVAKESTTNNWNVLVEMSYYRHQYAVEQEKDYITNELVSATLGAKMKSNQRDFTSPEVSFYNLVTNCKNAGLYSQSLTASMYLRIFFIDYQPDSTVVKEAKEQFSEAEAFFKKKDYKNAKEKYHKALSLQPKFYKATIYLGDCHWYLNDMDSAIYYFQKGIDMCPDLLEPRKYLVDALTYSKQYEKGKKECIDALYIYPDQSMYDKYDDLVSKSGSKFNQHWIKRGAEINKINTVETATKNAIWKHYQNAENDVKQYCDNNGLLQANNVTKTPYLEVYSWEKMLNSTTNLPSELLFAKKMADAGYLDCYVFISQFHYDLYPQYQEFVKENKERIKKYIEMYLTE